MHANERRNRLLGWLRRQGDVTAERAAAQFGVSLRTMRRDLAALRESGVVIEAEPGPGGGIRLDPRSPLPPVSFEVDEAIGVFLSLELAKTDMSFPFAAGAEKALAKLVAAMRPATAERLRRLLRRVVVGAPASPSVVGSLGKVSPQLLGVFERAFDRQCAMSFAYVDRRGVASRRRVEPHGVLLQSPAWYLLGVDVDKQVERMFRFDRIVRPALVESHTFTPRPLHVFDALLVPEVFGAGRTRLSDGPR